MDEFVKPKDLARGRAVPMRFELEVRLAAQTYKYFIAFEFPAGFKEMRVVEEGLSVDGNPVFTRELAQVFLANTNQEREARFRLDWHLAALPLVQERSLQDPLYVLRQWLARSIILRPVPSLIGLALAKDCRDGTELTWNHGLLRHNVGELNRLRIRIRPILFPGVFLTFNQAPR